MGNHLKCLWNTESVTSFDKTVGIVFGWQMTKRTSYYSTLKLFKQLKRRTSAYDSQGCIYSFYIYIYKYMRDIKSITN